MHAVSTSLVLLAMTCIASIVARTVRVPLPFVQIGVGVLAALPPIGLQVPLDPQTFLLLFIPPLLFSDGWNMPRRMLLHLRWPVLSHAVGLVLFTTVVGGYGLHWLIPSMPLAVGFAVAALVSPTDAVAVSALTEGVQVPRRMMHLLESEALLNDATGLVAMRFAVAATLSGGFSLWHAAGSFVVVAVGGMAVGWALTLVFSQLHRRLLTGARDAALQTVLAGLLPFAAYGIAESLEMSGILAAVAAGMAANRVSLLEAAHFSARLQTGQAWNVISFCLNGIIFVMLGLQLPGIIGSGPSGIDLLASPDRLNVVGEIGALTGLLIGLRLLWVLASVVLGRLSGAQESRPQWRVIVASSLAGVRGMVTLAGVLSLPLLMPDGTGFPSRDLAITLATGVILCSMVIAAIALPLLLRHVRDDASEAERESQAARVAAAQAAIRAVVARGPAQGSRAEALVGFYRDRLEALEAQAAAGKKDEGTAWRDLHRVALHAEREAVQALRASDDISDTVARQVLGELDLLEAALMQRPLGLPMAALPAGR